MSRISQIKKKLAKTNRTIAKRKDAIKNNIAKRFAFLARWKRSVAAWFRRIGNVIVRVSPPWLRTVGRFIRRPFTALNRRRKEYLARRPHRSFRVTSRRDYARSLKMPGYWSLTNQVRATLWKHKKLFGGLMLTYFLVALAIGGFGQQDAYKNLSDTLNETGGDIFTGSWGKVGQAGLLLTTSVATGLTPDVTAAQSVLGSLAVFFAWLATVWALRNIMAGRSVRVREAIYSSGSPVLATVLVGFILTLQLLPIAIAILLYNAAIYSELVVGGVEEMLLWCGLLLLGVLSLYWITSTIIALVVVTLPGMYPFQAIRTAGDLVIGRRLRILLRLLWAGFLVIVTWAIIIIPVILIDAWIKKVWPVIDWVPTVPITILAMSSVTIIVVAAYVYTLYRKVVDDDAKPA